VNALYSYRVANTKIIQMIQIVAENTGFKLLI